MTEVDSIIVNASLYPPFENSVKLFKSECSSDKVATWNEEDCGCFERVVFFLNMRG